MRIRKDRRNPDPIPSAKRGVHVKRRSRVTDNVRVTEESLSGYPDATRLGWILDVIEDGGAGVSYEVVVSLPSTRGT